MLLGVISDTHGHVPFTQAAVRMLESLEVETVIHCGDIGSADIVSLFALWPAHFVFGNVDYDRRGLRAAISSCGQTCHETFGELTLAGRRIAFLHGDDEERLDETIASQDYQLVCHGHTHVARREQRGATLILNPGAVYRADPHSVAVVELPS
jgi:putative phosphoesterase